MLRSPHIDAQNLLLEREPLYLQRVMSNLPWHQMMDFPGLTWTGLNVGGPPARGDQQYGSATQPDRSFNPHPARAGGVWSLDILPSEKQAIPKGLYHSAQGCEQRATLGGGW